MLKSRTRHVSTNPSWWFTWDHLSCFCTSCLGVYLPQWSRDSPGTLVAVSLQLFCQSIGWLEKELRKELDRVRNQLLLFVLLGFCRFKVLRARFKGKVQEDCARTKDRWFWWIAKTGHSCWLEMFCKRYKSESLKKPSCKLWGFLENFYWYGNWDWKSH